MSCCFPLKAFKTGFLTDNGKDDFFFVAGHTKVIDVSSCPKPINLSNVSYHFLNGHAYLDEPIDIPCGKCVGCRMDDARQWKIRCCLEMKYHRFCYFITLTYDDEHLPFNDCGEPVLLKEDLQKFWKRFRRAGYVLSYFSCGEYGDTTHRPHFHALVYLDRDLQGFSVIAPYKYTCDTLKKLWPFGYNVVEEVSPGNIAYVTGYVEKKQLSYLYGEYPSKPFRLMSRKPGIGMSYIRDHIESIESTRKVYGNFSDDCRDSSSRIPRSMLRKFEDTEWYRQLKEDAKLAAENMSEVMNCVYRTVDQEELGTIREERLYKIIDKRRSVL